ncbi:MAG: hypothetical protein ACREFE_18060, partial [Limisphaerales bacterium]
MALLLGASLGPGAVRGMIGAGPPGAAVSDPLGDIGTGPPGAVGAACAQIQPASNAPVTDKIKLLVFIIMFQATRMPATEKHFGE